LGLLVKEAIDKKKAGTGKPPYRPYNLYAPGRIKPRRFFCLSCSLWSHNDFLFVK